MRCYCSFCQKISEITKALIRQYPTVFEKGINAQRSQWQWIAFVPRILQFRRHVDDAIRRVPRLLHRFSRSWNFYIDYSERYETTLWECGPSRLPITMAAAVSNIPWYPCYSVRKISIFDYDPIRLFWQSYVFDLKKCRLNIYRNTCENIRVAASSNH